MDAVFVILISTGIRPDQTRLVGPFSDPEVAEQRADEIRAMPTLGSPPWVSVTQVEPAAGWGG